MIRSVTDAKEAFPNLKWRDISNNTGDMAFAICGGDKDTGDITILLAMGARTQSPLHRHRKRENWPFREMITCLSGELYGVDPENSGFVLKAGQTADLSGDSAHEPYVTDFALVLYRQPAGHDLVE